MQCLQRNCWEVVVTRFRETPGKIDITHASGAARGSCHVLVNESSFFCLRKLGEKIAICAKAGTAWLPSLQFPRRAVWSMRICMGISVFIISAARDAASCVSTGIFFGIRQKKKGSGRSRERLPDQTIPVHTELPCPSRSRESYRQCHWPHRWGRPRKTSSSPTMASPQAGIQYFQRERSGRSRHSDPGDPRDKPTQLTLVGRGRAVVMHLSTIRHF